jgi:polysaccharide export outer membrane protein
VLAIGLPLAACSLPAAGPTSGQLESSANNSEFPFHLVKVDGRVVSILQRYRGATFGASFRTNRYVATNALRSGDVVSITVYETGGSTLFPPPVSTPSFGGASTQQGNGPSGNSTIPPQIVEADGTISVPFVGRVRVAGQTPGQVGRIIEQQLQGKAVEPQVIVTLVQNMANSATVGGDVNAPRIVPLSLRGERLLDVIAAAGGARFPAHETYVQIVRQGRAGTALLQTVVNDPAENIIVRPTDQIFLTRNPRTFAVLGATHKVALYNFDSEKVSLAEAIARAGGPIDTIGDPGGIYLFRFEPWAIAQEIMASAEVDSTAVTAMGAEVNVVADVRPDFVPMLYRVGLREAEGYFLSQAIQIRDKDVILISNAEATQLQKTLAVVRGFTGIAYDLRRNVIN